MNKIKREQVRHVAHLARLKLSELELKLFENQLSSILKYVEHIAKADEKGTLRREEVLSEKALRRDKVDHRQVLSQKEALKNSENTTDGLFQVKKVF